CLSLLNGNYCYRNCSTTVILLFFVLFLSSCSQSIEKSIADSTSKNRNSESTHEVNNKNSNQNPLTIKKATAKQNGKWITVNVQLENHTSSAQLLKPELFALVVNKQVLSTDPKSEIPNQIPAKTNSEILLQFDKKELEGTYNMRLAYQPMDTSHSEQFYDIGKFTIKKWISSPKNESALKENTDHQASDEITTGEKTSQNQGTSGQIELETQSVGAITVKIPTGWKKSPYEGGDFGGYKYTNPVDSNEQMLVVYSSCAGCGYPDGDLSNTPDPKSLISENVTSSFVFNKGLSAGYSYYQTGNPYRGDGVVTMKPGEGYGFVELTLSPSNRSVATEILNSFVFHGVH
ncbi:MAG: hypothetical protein IMW92_07840, partial [Bacillales bacterium]|nr:hypothetical protein [Bacillales bacterium]